MARGQGIEEGKTAQDSVKGRTGHIQQGKSFIYIIQKKNVSEKIVMHFCLLCTCPLSHRVKI